MGPWTGSEFFVIVSANGSCRTGMREKESEREREKETDRKKREIQETDRKKRERNNQINYQHNKDGPQAGSKFFVMRGHKWIV
jgi:hypothetical protein